MGAKKYHSFSFLENILLIILPKWSDKLNKALVVVLGKFESEYIHLLVNTILKLNILEKAVEMVGNIILGPEWSVDIILHCK